MSDTDEPINGPIVACDNAIDHYDRSLAALAESERKLVEQLMRNRQDQNELRNMRFQWRNARDALVAAQRKAMSDGGISSYSMCPHGHGPLENESCPDCGFSK